MKKVLFFCLFAFAVTTNALNLAPAVKEVKSKKVVGRSDIFAAVLAIVNTNYNELPKIYYDLKKNKKAVGASDCIKKFIVLDKLDGLEQERVIAILIKLLKIAKNVFERNSDDAICGICEKKGIDVLWFSKNSFGVHRECYFKLKDIDEKFTAEMRQKFNYDNREINFANSVMMGAVRKKCGCSIAKYIKSHSLKEFNELYTSVGGKALNEYYKSYLADLI